MTKRRAQMVVAAVLIIGLLVMSILVTVYEAHTLFLTTRSPVVRETVGAITADFKRAIAAMLALATRAYFNYSEFTDFTDRFGGFGVSAYNRHNFTVARIAAKTYLEYWRQSIMKAYGEYGAQVSYQLLELNLSQELGRPRSVNNLMKGYWYLPVSGSYAYAKLKLNLTALGFYNWESDVFVGLTVTVYRNPVSVTASNVTIILNVRQDGDLDYSRNPPSVRGAPYGRLITSGWVRIYYPEKDAQGRYTGAWRQARIKDITYGGMGNYSITFEPAVDVLTDPLTKEQYVPIMVVVSDERGIIVEASTYKYIVFSIQRNTPDTLVYYDSSGQKQTLNRPSDISNEVYTLEMSSNLSFYWLNTKLQIDPNLKLPPFPYIPIKQIRVNTTLRGTNDVLNERPIQYENWTTTIWRLANIPVNLPVGLSDPQMDFVRGDKYNTRLVFQVKFPSTSIKQQLVALWWKDDLDAQPAAYPTQITYIWDSTHKDIMHPLYDVELVDLEHPQSRGYLDYEGVAAAVLRDPQTDFAFGPYNLHAFDTYGSSLGRYRPYGVWKVYYSYLRYSWIQAPIRIFALLNTTFVGNVYASGDVRSDYYATLSILSVVNGTRYVPVLTYVYWMNNQDGEGYWLATEMGRGVADWFLYLTAGLQAISNVKLQNRTYNSPFPWRSDPPVECYPDPGIMLAHWSWSGDLGRALILNWNGVQKLYSVGGSDARFCTTKYAPGGTKQGSIEYVFWPSDVERTVNKGTLVAFWNVIFDFRSSGPGFGTYPGSDAWKNAYIYASMFLENYAPKVGPPP
ncbi:hypothetical protein MA03_05135 [Infirmifilum uzonense]|uniref:Uncharacterized protein n=1 Tax=Infirmifilum uzonense TaxID=1550241 RepID=A0A0F7CL46_9CREN|nr:hypothetical protein [Infirmifilum uzonense]AKG38776.1 hypothetical protein MA03_05135 [Infirmifilum uzonense]